MCARKMHADEVDTDVSLVRRLLATQFPAWTDLPIERVESAGTDNAIYRLGDGLAARLPRIPEASGQPTKERRWLPALAPLLPLAIPVPLATGSPGEGYPWEWSVCPWLEGENATVDRIADLREAAHDLAGTIAALQRIDPAGGPPPSQGNSFRGEPLANRDTETRAAIASLDGMFDEAELNEAWEAVLRAPTWDGQPRWIHGDLQPGNLLAVHGRLSAVIDFGCLGVGDPACDLIVAWSLFAGDSRGAFRAALHVDDATWARGRGWALSTALIFIPYYVHTNPAGVRNARRVVDEVLADHRAGS